MKSAISKAKSAVVDLLKAIFKNPDPQDYREYYPASEFTAEAERIRRRHSAEVMSGLFWK